MNHQKTHLPQLAILSLAHTMNDWYSNFLPQLLPFILVLRPGFSAVQAALLISAFNISSSLFQPIFGYFSDGKGRGWLMYLGTLWMAVFLSLIGGVSDFSVMLVLAAVSGLGTAAFHPQASAMVHGLSVRYKAVYQSTFVAFGNLGFALAPLLLIPLFQCFGLGASWVTVIPGIATAALLFFTIRVVPQENAKPGNWKMVGASILKVWKPLGAVVGVISLRAVTYTGILALLPLFLHHQGAGSQEISLLLTLMLASGALGGVCGGFLSDLWGRKKLTSVSLMLAAPLLLGFLASTGVVSVVFLALAGACLMASFSVTVVAAQEVIPNNKALAAGISLGFANGVGALAVIAVGWGADLWGLEKAMFFLFVFPLFAGATAFFMPKQTKGVKS